MRYTSPNTLILLVFVGAVILAGAMIWHDPDLVMPFLVGFAMGLR